MRTNTIFGFFLDYLDCLVEKPSFIHLIWVNHFVNQLLKWFSSMVALGVEVKMIVLQNFFLFEVASSHELLVHTLNPALKHFVRLNQIESKYFAVVVVFFYIHEVLSKNWKSGRNIVSKFYVKRPWLFPKAWYAAAQLPVGIDFGCLDDSTLDVCVILFSFL